MSWITPISLFTSMTDTRIVSGRIAAFELLEVEQAVVLRRRGRSTSKPWRSSSRIVSSTALCSVFTRDEVLALGLVEVRRALDREVVRLRSRPRSRRSRADRQSTSAATCARASSTAASASQPNACAARRRVAEVLASGTESSSSATRGSTGVVAE